MTLQLDSANIPTKLWPQPTSAECQITIGKTLTITLTTFNKGQHEVTISEALHSYFLVSDVRNISINGLHRTFRAHKKLFSELNAQENNWRSVLKSGMICFLEQKWKFRHDSVTCSRYSDQSTRCASAGQILS